MASFNQIISNELPSVMSDQWETVTAGRDL